MYLLIFYILLAKELDYYLRIQHYQPSSLEIPYLMDDFSFL